MNEGKTRVCCLPEEKFDFLGYSFGRCYSTKTGRAYLGSVPSKKRVQRICCAISEETGPDLLLLDPVTVLSRLNRKMTGWANYFCLGPVRPATPVGYSASTAGFSPKLSDFYDVYGGENAWRESQYEDHQYLPSGGKGRYTGGPQQGLQAEILAIVNDDWGHFKQDQPIGPPKMSADAFIAKMKDAMSRGEVPVLDVEIYQDGTISAETLRLFQAIRNAVKRKPAPTF